MSIGDFLDAIDKVKEAAPGALAEISAGASNLGKQLSGKASEPDLWIRFNAEGDPISCTKVQREDPLGEGERELRYRAL